MCTCVCVFPWHVLPCRHPVLFSGPFTRAGDNEEIWREECGRIHSQVCKYNISTVCKYNVCVCVCVGTIIQIMSRDSCSRGPSTEDKKPRTMNTRYKGAFKRLTSCFMYIYLWPQTLHTECITYTTAYRFPGILRWFEVVDTDIVSL